MKEYRARITHGMLNNKEFYSDLFKADGVKVVVTLAQDTGKKRSIPQNAYWFGVLNKYAVPVFREYGDNWTDYKIHEYLMNELGYQEVLTDHKGRVFITRKESKKFSTVQWEEYMEGARALLATEHSVVIPLPNEEIPAIG